MFISFENEYVFMWRGRDWKLFFLLFEDGGMDVKSFEIVNRVFLSLYDFDFLVLEDEEELVLCFLNILN